MIIDKYRIQLIINKEIDYIKDDGEKICVFYFEEKSLKNIRQFDLISYYIPFFFLKRYRDVNLKFISYNDYKFYFRNKNLKYLLS